MSAKRLRICLFCHKVGITVEFPNGNQMRTHIRVRHPRSAEQYQAGKFQLREYRRSVLLAQGNMRTRPRGTK